MTGLFGYRMVRWTAEGLALWLLVSLTAMTVGWGWNSYVRTAVHWVEYDGVSYYGRTADDKLRFVSRSAFYVPVRWVEWEDILYCDVGDGMGFNYWSMQVLKRTNPERSPMKDRPWIYGASVPQETSRCYLRATITIGTRFWVTKEVVKTTEVFAINGR